MSSANTLQAERVAVDKLSQDLAASNLQLDRCAGRLVCWPGGGVADTHLLAKLVSQPLAAEPYLHRLLLFGRWLTENEHLAKAAEDPSSLDPDAVIAGKAGGRQGRLFLPFFLFLLSALHLSNHRKPVDTDGSARG